MNILITGFAPFGGDGENPSQLALEALPGAIAGARLAKRLLPVSFLAAQRAVCAAIASERPDAVLLTGLAGGRAKISLERAALNVKDARMPDNDGDCPVDQPIRADGPAAYFATLPLKAMVARMLSQDIPARISNTAGTYVCNDLMYRLLHLLATAYPGVKGGFLHVPYATSQRHPALPSMPLGEIARGLQCAIEAMLLPPEP